MTARLRFLGCNKNLDEAKAVFCGAWFNDGESREHAPDIIRGISRQIDDYHILTGKNLSSIGIHDCGDIILEKGDKDTSFEPLADFAASIFSRRKMLFTIGEDREISYGLIKAAAKRFENLRVLSIDAHHGREEIGEGINSYNFLTHCLADFLPAENLLQLGIRCGSRDSYNAGLRRHRHLPPRVKRGMLERLPRLYHVPVYVTIDLDVLEPCYAPGVDFPIPGGICVTELIEAIRYFESVSVIGADICGIDLRRDNSSITASLIGNLVKESYIYFLANNKFTS